MHTWAPTRAVLVRCVWTLAQETPSPLRCQCCQQEGPHPPQSPCLLQGLQAASDAETQRPSRLLSGSRHNWVGASELRPRFCAFAVWARPVPGRWGSGHGVGGCLAAGSRRGARGPSTCQHLCNARPLNAEGEHFAGGGGGNGG